MALLLLGVIACSSSGRASGHDKDRGPVVIEVGDDAAAVVAEAPPGSEFRFSAGLHRGVAIVARDGDHFIGEQGAVLSGAVVIEGFVNDGGVWSAPSPPATTPPEGRCRPDRPTCGYPEELFKDGARQDRVLDRADLVEGTWLYDAAAGRAVLPADPADALVELSATRFGIAGTALDVVVKGLVFERYANRAQVGVIDMAEGARRWAVSDCVVRQSHAVGAVVRDESTIRGCRLVDNGQQGLGGSGVGLLAEDNLLSGNNRAGFDPGWSAGGAKFAFAVRLQVLRNTVLDNGGPGLWCDIDCDDVLYEGNQVEGNTDAGIFHEISRSAEIRDNTVIGNGTDSPGWVFGAGIQVAGSSDVTVTGNVVEGNHHGIIGLEQRRGSGAHGPWVLERLTVLGNTVRNSGQTGIAQDYGNVAVYERGHRFDENRYEGDAVWSWLDAVRSWEEWQGYGHDPAGTYTPGPAPGCGSCPTTTAAR